MAASYAGSQESPYKGRLLKCNVKMLDNTISTIPVPLKSLGQLLFDAVVNKLQLMEADYFDLEYNDSDAMPCWLDREKPTIKQVSPNSANFRFLVKFYTPDPGLLEEELTRYLYALQIKSDLLSGSLMCQEHTAVLLASYAVQAEVGNFCEELLEQDYLSKIKLLQNQNKQVELKIIEHHKEHFGQTPAEADFNLLDTARKVEFYGIHMNPAKDHEGISLHLAVAHSGIIVFQNYTKINSFSWAKIRKLCFKRKKFMIKLHPENYSYNKDIVEFYFPTRNWSKNFWKRCIEHHAFFRCHTVKHVARNKSRVVSRGSSFRYSGKTQKELVEYVRENYVRPAVFERSASLRTMSVVNSRTGTPRTGTLNSRDLHMGMGLYGASFSSGSHTLERGGSGSVHAVNSTSFDHSGPLRFDERDEIAMERRNVGDMSPGMNSYHHQQQLRAGSNSYLNQQHLQYQQQQQHMMYKPPPGNNIGHMGMTGGMTGGSIDPSLFMLSKNGHRASSQTALTTPGGYMGSGRYETSSPYHDNNHHAMMNNSFQHHQPPQQPYQHQQQLIRSTASLNRPTGYPPYPQPHHPTSGPMGGRGTPSSVPGDMLSSPHHRYHLNSTTTSVDEDLPPPPPPPLADDSIPPSGGSSLRLHGYAERRLGNSMMTGTSKSTTSAASVTLTSNASIMSSQTDESEEEGRRRSKFAADKTYYYAKELLMTERTYRKDLEIITQVLRETLSNDDVMPVYLMELIFDSLTPIYEFHCGFLRDIEQHLAVWEGKSSLQINSSSRRVGAMLSNLSILPVYRSYLDRHEEILLQLDVAMKKNKDLERVVMDFESQKVCYLPISCFILKPLQRLLHYRLIIEKVLKTYTDDHPDIDDCKLCLEQLNEVIKPSEEKLKHLVNWQRLIDLQHDLNGCDNLVLPKRILGLKELNNADMPSNFSLGFLIQRKLMHNFMFAGVPLLQTRSDIFSSELFIREGCLQKLSRKGFQQRMFFLFSDVLLYTSRTANPSLQFKVHGQLLLKGMTVEDTDPQLAAPELSFTIYSSNRCLVVAASSQEEKDKWVEDLQKAIQSLVARGLDDDDDVEDGKLLYASLKSNSSSEALDESHDEPMSPERQANLQQRANTVMHVCWHRSTSVSVKDHLVAVQNQLSGYLLRKFKNSNGWQKLWVVFTNFCLFFYKSYQDEVPLASLPLLGYSIGTPSPADNIHKDFVFKLQFKNHVYFFRAESDTTFERWIEVIGSVTCSARITRTFSRMDSTVTPPHTQLSFNRQQIC